MIITVPVGLGLKAPAWKWSCPWWLRGYGLTIGLNARRGLLCVDQRKCEECCEVGQAFHFINFQPFNQTSSLKFWHLRCACCFSWKCYKMKGFFSCFPKKKKNNCTRGIFMCVWRCGDTMPINLVNSLSVSKNRELLRPKLHYVGLVGMQLLHHEV